jgi:hypothetical protein
MANLNAKVTVEVLPAADARLYHDVAKLARKVLDCIYEFEKIEFSSEWIEALENDLQKLENSRSFAHNEDPHRVAVDLTTDGGCEAALDRARERLAKGFRERLKLGHRLAEADAESERLRDQMRRDQTHSEVGRALCAALSRLTMFEELALDVEVEEAWAGDGITSPSCYDIRYIAAVVHKEDNAVLAVEKSHDLAKALLLVAGLDAATGASSHDNPDSKPAKPERRGETCFKPWCGMDGKLCCDCAPYGSKQ